ncbi:DExH-box splicing factor binding site-domain-containing protein [Fimicolochytrium jonesii]|uniref:DExH-box splicing factor binding site-domain-containing protein n=1 Tax=Fimicolochytrium jonesii TaxID=1396493 RepID=UPI0022FDD570|nr:DExH-box splicing factor binding site-domain-containing protein [Fimicolochytrium jonesii]KAI8819372.1 DExH-box splicing factor binding site-domain-containing protein [Fimicolochytrium jonesii]
MSNSASSRGNSPYSTPRSGTPSSVNHNVKLALGSSRLGRSQLEADSDSDDESRTNRPDELINGLSGAGFVGSKRGKSREQMVIPLIKQNEWRGRPDMERTPSTEGPRTTTRTVTRTTTTVTSTAVTAGPAASTTISQTTTVTSEGLTPMEIAGDASQISQAEESHGPKFGLQVMKKRKVVRTTDSVASCQSGASTPLTVGEEEPAAAVTMTVEEEAMAAVLREAQGIEAEWTPSITSLPILAQNSVPGLNDIEDVTEKYRYDVSLRPEESTMEDYERVPIAEFGQALLRGMGWEKGKAVGKNPDGLIEPISLKSRPHLLGLGATPAPELEIKQKKYIKPGEKRRPDPLAEAKLTPSEELPRSARREKRERSPDRDVALRAGDVVRINEGRYEGQQGVIQEIKSRSSGTVVKVEMDGSRDIARCWLQDIQRISPSSNGHRSQSKSQSVSRASSAGSSSARSWLRPHALVRVVSKSLASGRHYNQKGVIQDVFTAGECVLRLNTGDIVEGVKDRHLETCLPSVGGTVIVLQSSDGELVGQLGRLKEKDSESERAVVQMDHSLEYHTFTYDEIAAYIE